MRNENDMRDHLRTHISSHFDYPQPNSECNFHFKSITLKKNSFVFLR